MILGSKWTPQCQKNILSIDCCQHHETIASLIPIQYTCLNFNIAGYHITGCIYEPEDTHHTGYWFYIFYNIFFYLYVYWQSLMRLSDMKFKKIKLSVHVWLPHMVLVQDNLLMCLGSTDLIMPFCLECCTTFENRCLGYLRGGYSVHITLFEMTLT